MGKFANGATTAAFSALFSEGLAAANDSAYVDGDDWLTGYELPEGYYNDKVAWGWGDPLPQGLVDVTAGFGDTFGAGYIRSSLGIDGGINYDSGYYMGGQVVGAVTPGLGTAATLRGAAYLGKSVRWLNTGKNWRIGPGVISRTAGAKPFNNVAGRNIPMLRIGNKTPSSLNHFDLRVLGK